MNLYHYTSISALALILRSRTLRLTRLDLVDDLTEGTSRDVPSIGKYYFVSSWTDIAEESIPFWKMYTPDMKGVRIGLPENPFLYYLPDPSGSTIERKPFTFAELPARGLMNTIPTYDRKFLSDAKLAYKYHMFVEPRDVLRPITYFRSLSDLERDYFNSPVLEESDGRKYLQFLRFNDSKIGTSKLEAWEFQSEWRYRLGLVLNSSLFFGHLVDGVFQRYFDEDMAVFPELQSLIQQRAEHMQTRSVMRISELEAVKKVYQDEAPAFDAIYVDLSEEAIHKLDVLLGPKCTFAEETIVQALLGAYAPGTIFSTSTLSGTIR